MQKIKEYKLKKDVIAPQTIYVTKNAKVVNLVDLDYDLTLIVVCDALEQDNDLRTFKICDSYANIYEENITYIGNFGNQHVIEIC